MKKIITTNTIQLETPLGPMIAVADATHLLSLSFIDKTPTATPAPPANANHKILTTLRHELDAYFSGSLDTFTVPLNPAGTSFQQKTWAALLKVPFGTTQSYGEQAKGMGKPTAFRAVARANGANPISILIPCHRIINSNGKLGGYASGLDRKQWLLEHEQRC